MKALEASIATVDGALPTPSALVGSLGAPAPRGGPGGGDAALSRAADLLGESGLGARALVVRLRRSVSNVPLEIELTADGEVGEQPIGRDVFVDEVAKRLRPRTLGGGGARLGHSGCVHAATAGVERAAEVELWKSLVGRFKLVDAVARQGELKLTRLGVVGQGALNFLVDVDVARLKVVGSRGGVDAQRRAP